MNHYVQGYLCNGRNRYRVLRPDGSLVVSLNDSHHSAIVVAQAMDRASGIEPRSYEDLEASVWPERVKAYERKVRNGD